MMGFMTRQELMIAVKCPRGCAFPQKTHMWGHTCTFVLFPAAVPATTRSPLLGVRRSVIGEQVDQADRREAMAAAMAMMWLMKQGMTKKSKSSWLALLAASLSS